MHRCMLSCTQLHCKVPRCQGAKDTGLDPTFPDSELCHSTTHRRAKIFGFVSVLLPHRHPEPRNLKFYLYRRSKQRLRPGKGVARRWQSRSRSKSSFWTSVGRSYFRIRLPCFQGQGGWVGDLCLGSVTCIAQR